MYTQSHASCKTLLNAIDMQFTQEEIEEEDDGDDVGDEIKMLHICMRVYSYMFMIDLISYRNSLYGKKVWQKVKKINAYLLCRMIYF